MKSLKKVLRLLFNKRKDFRDLTFVELAELMKSDRKAVKRGAFNRMFELAKTPEQALIALEKSELLGANQKEKALKKLREFKKFKEWRIIYEKAKSEEVKIMAIAEMDRLAKTVKKRIVVLEIEQERKTKKMINGVLS